MIIEHRGKEPQIDPSAYIAPNPRSRIFMAWVASFQHSSGL